MGSASAANQVLVRRLTGRSIPKASDAGNDDRVSIMGKRRNKETSTFRRLNSPTVSDELPMMADGVPSKRRWILGLKRYWRQLEPKSMVPIAAMTPLSMPATKAVRKFSYRKTCSGAPVMSGRRGREAVKVVIVSRKVWYKGREKK